MVLLLWGVTLACLAALDWASYQAFAKSVAWWVGAP